MNPPLRAPAAPSWPPISLGKLFAGKLECPLGRPACRPKVVSEEALYMEVLAAEHSDEEPDARALEGSGEDYEG
ncbi:hypothetical protein B0H16DRAFT_1335084 [Mycena metata]|uniref:Uncharacterized protein n=1 Tax=Mycena metata TaxID=1033252 RepID=A0AAD7MKM0_9AGAR|nr:hypothetical protein B0H16DRAFT_1335084 [Mycena metata]